MVRVFVSYALEDRDFAESLVEHLKTAGINVSDPLSQLAPGDNWPLEIGQALERSDAMVVLVSPASARSETVKRDIEYALSSKRFSGRLIPVIVRPAPKAPWILNRLHPEKGNPTRVSKRILQRLERFAPSAN
jgi:hypothetical protein